MLNQGKHLKHVVLSNVLERPNTIIKGSTTLHSDLFKQFYMHLVDIFSVPERFKKRVCKSKCKNILEGFFCKIVVDSKDLIFIEEFSNILQRSLGGSTGASGTVPAAAGFSASGH